MILVLNCGSQSIKFKVFNNDFKIVKTNHFKVKNSKDYQLILNKELKSIDNIDKVCHRVVHGGNKFKDPLRINKSIINELKKCNKLAPLHNPYNILGIETALKIFPKAKQVAVFDTGFYKDIPQKAYLYALPNRYGFRKYGFHGISHEYASKKAAEIVDKNFNKLNIISCHLGGGSSVTAIKNGKAIDTSMGYTPLEGVVMMSRSGSIDPGIILELGKLLSFDKIEDVLNKESGIKGICGYSEMLKVLEMIKKGDNKSKLALDVFVYSIQKYISSYFGILGGCDLLVFTGMIGAGSSKIRNMITKDLKILKNTKVMSVEPDEELMIVKKSKNL